jgi:hypothetical protein
MLNPSTADGHRDDATIRRCVGFAKRWGYGGIWVANLYAWRARDPRELLAGRVGTEHLVGPGNDYVVGRLAQRADLTVMAWGAHPAGQRRDGFGVERDHRVTELLVEHARTLGVLGRTAGGHPVHPLRQPGSLQPAVIAGA